MRSELSSQEVQSRPRQQHFSHDSIVILMDEMCFTSWQKLKRFLHFVLRRSPTNNNKSLHLLNRSEITRLLLFTFLCAFSIHRLLANWNSQRIWMNAPITNISRQCPAPPYETLSTSKSSIAPKICLTTLTDEKYKAWTTKVLGWRNFDGLLDITWKNKANYAQKHGYHLYDGSNVLDRTRPPSWSKIRAVQRLLQEEACDWVFWLDADTVVMNSDKRIEDFLPLDPTKDLLLSADDGGGYNAGAWLIHNTEWARHFLDTWWNMRSFVRPPGLSKSGDNDALKALTKDMTDLDQHVLAPPRCTFNSFARFLEPKEYDHVLANVERQEWYMKEGYYHKGDFIAHVAGVDNKDQTLQLLLQEAQ